MGNFWNSLVLIIVCVGLQSQLSDAGYCGDWIPIDWRPLAKEIEPSDEIQVYALVAPLLYCDYKDVLSYINAYHGGIAFTNLRTNKSFTVNYDASPSFTRAIIPAIQKSPNGTVDLLWENYGKVFLYDGINATYWHSENLLVATLNGTQMYNFMAWLAKGNSSFPYYNLWSVWTGWPGTQILPNNECFQFVWACFRQLKEARPMASMITLYSSSQPTQVNETDPTEWKNLVMFYETLEAKISQEGMDDFLLELWEIVVDGLFYIRINNGYMKVKLKFPYVGIHYTSLPGPWNL